MSQLLVTIGLLLAAGALLVAGAVALARSTSVVTAAAPELLEVPAIRDAVKVEFERAIQAAYGDEVVPDESLQIASERMAQNGYMVDAFVESLAVAHVNWLDGGDLAVDIDDRVATQAAMTGLRDADIALAERLPPSQLVQPGSVASPWGVSASTAASVARTAVMAALVGVVVFLVGAVMSPRRGRPLKSLARTVVGAGLVIVATVLVLPMQAIWGIDSRIGVVGSLAATQFVPLLVLAGVLVFLGLWVHATADRVVASVNHAITKSRRSTKAAAPMRSGSRPVKPSSRRGREQAIDAFFDREGDVIDARDPIDDDAAEPGDGAGSEDAEDEELSPEEARARVLAAERREALERIDGTKGRYRTHLGR